MVPLMSLWLPILLSAVAVFVASSLVHMVLGYHKSDFAKVPSENEVMDGLRKFSIPPGDYLMPRPGSPADMKSPEYLDKMNKGPVAMIRVLPGGPIQMGGTFVQWIVFLLVVSTVAGYVTRAHEPGDAYMDVFGTVCTVAFASYAFGTWPESIWYKRQWSTSLKTTFDAVLYGAITAGVFASMWPK